MKQKIVFSHGFGVEKDDRGLFTDIAEELDRKCVLFDYNQVNQNGLTVIPIDKQADKLKEVLSQQPKPVDLICHSQGCVVAALLSPENVRKTIFTAPPQDTNIARMMNFFSQRPGTELNRGGMSRLARSDGSTTLVPASYWESLEQIDSIKSLYRNFAQKTDLIIIKASQDEVVGQTDFDYLQDLAKITSISAGHNFTGAARGELIRCIKEELK